MQVSGSHWAPPSDSGPERCMEEADLRLLEDVWAYESSRPGFRSWLCLVLACEILAPVCISFLTSAMQCVTSISQVVGEY